MIRPGRFPELTDVDMLRQASWRVLPAVLVAEKGTVSMTWLHRARACGLAASLVVLGMSSRGAAQVDTTAVSPGARGTIGGAVLGAELAMLIEAGFGVKPKWLYLVGGGAGAVGGAFVGLESDQAGNTPLSMTLLVSGVLLAIPTTIAVLSATSYRAPAAREEGVIATHTAGVRLTRTHSFSEYYGDSLALRAPAMKPSSVHSRKLRDRLEGSNTTQMLVPVFLLTF